MGFQIHNKDDQAINLNELDKEAAEFWGKTLDKASYAYPTKGPDHTGNWFDVIGYQIHNPETNYTSGWNNIKASLWSVQSTSMYDKLFDEKKYVDNDKEFTSLDIALMVTKEFLKPYFDLIDHWESKGYKPVQIKE